MNYLLDTHIVLWATAKSSKLSQKAAEILADPASNLYVSAVTFWEVAIKTSQNKPGFNIQVGPLRAGLFSNGYLELPVESRHILILPSLPFHHSDPFDRLLVAQCKSDGIPLLTSDRQLEAYGDWVHAV